MSKAKKPARTLQDFRAAHDRNVIVPNKIKKALAEMATTGPEHYEYEADFIKIAGISQTDLGQFRDLFTPHIVETAGIAGRAGRRVWFATAAAAKKARGE